MKYYPGKFRSRIIMPRRPYFYARVGRIRNGVFMRKDRGFIETINKMAGRAASLIEKLEPKPESAIERVAFYYSGGKRHGPGPWPMNKQAGIVLSRNGFRVKVLGDDGVEYDIDSALIEKLEGRG